MPISSAPSTSRRLLALLSLLQSRRDWPAHVLATRLEVSERTVRRDVDRLRELDYVIDATRGPDGGYRLGAGANLPPLMLDDEQAVAVAIALQSAGALGAGIDEAADRALATITRTMPSRLAHRIRNLSAASDATPRETPADPEVLLRITDAIRAQEELRFDYASPTANADAPVRRVEPHHLLLHGGRWYLLGFAPDRDEWRVYRADRVTPRSHNGRRFTPRPVPGGDAAAYLQARFKGSTEANSWPCWAEVVLRAPLDAVAPFVGDGTAEAVGSDRTRMRLGAWSWTALAAEIGRFDAEIEVVGPPELRDAFAALARRFTRSADRTARTVPQQ